VTDPEPLPADHALWDLPNVILSPHVSGAIQNYGPRSTALFAANLKRYLSNEPLANVVKVDLGY
jgi:phosphoglycerate dehydrogenase-like enzyme